MTRRIVNAAALGCALGILIGLGAAAAAVWAHGDLQHATFRLMAMRTRDAVTFWVLACAALMVPIAVMVGRVRPGALVGERSGLRVAAAASVVIVVLLHAGIALDARRRAPPATNIVLIVVDALRADHLGSYG